ncbi:MAG: hypothetical protein KDD45_12655 [Bdellovibrionales bacterium]|nr:hypothetical protein [Bdellovibrionales bacterium]
MIIDERVGKLESMVKALTRKMNETIDVKKSGNPSFGRASKKSTSVLR